MADEKDKDDKSEATKDREASEDRAKENAQNTLRAPDDQVHEASQRGKQ